MYISTIISLATLAVAAPQRQRGGNRNANGNRNGNGNGNTRQQATAFQQADQIPQGLSTATDGSTILDATVTINDLSIRFKISAPADQFLATSDVPGAAATSSNGTLGINVLLHGDGGQSFFDFPNQAVQANTMGVALLAPDANLFWGGGSGLERTDGVAHSQAVNDFIQTALPEIVAFDKNAVVFTGVSGGALMLSGFFVPGQIQNYPNSAVELNCGALAPQVDVVDAAAVVGTTIHYQSTQQELQSLQQSIPEAIVAYEQLAVDQGLTANEINALQTVDNTPVGGHCEFDGQDFVSGVQTMLSSFSNVMQGGDGTVQGLGTPSNGQVRAGVVGNENLQFGNGGRKRNDADMTTVMTWAEGLRE